MWKRLQGHVREKERHAQIGNPVLLETTYDENQLRQNPNVNDAQVANYRNNAPAPLLSYNISPDDPPNYRASEVATVSSLYSRPSHDLSYYYENHATMSPYEDVSPPSSPEPERYLSTTTDQPKRFRSMRDVSPIDENRKKLESVPRPVSNIPVLRRAPPALQTGEPPAAPKQKFWEGKLAPNSKVKWDDYSGEPSSAGKAASVSPGSYAKATPSESRPMGYSATISGPEKKNATLTERIGRFASKPAPVEPWSRVSGRSEIAPALKDDPTAKPLQLPRKEVSPAVPRTDPVQSNSLAPVSDRDVQAAVTRFVTTETLDFDMRNEPIKPIVPLKVGRKGSPGSGFISPTSPTNKGLGIHPFAYPSPTTPTPQRSGSPDTVLSVPRDAALPPAQRTTTPPYTTAESKNAKETYESGGEVSASRFSWTTYNSATTYQHSPPPSPPPPLPFSTPLQKQRVVTEPITAASSILSRRRPVPQADRISSSPSSTVKTPLRSPSPSAAMPGTAKIHSPSAFSPTTPTSISTLSTTNTTKALPQPPTHLSASDHIGLLESQLEDLRIRRTNVYRLLSDLNNAAPPNPLITDFKRARMVEARKRGFEDELSEIKREEHDVGLKLHRAWKKREREDPGAGSVLWVRRVTS